MNSSYKPVVFVWVMIYTERKSFHHSSREWNVKGPEYQQQVKSRPPPARIHSCRSPVSLVAQGSTLTSITLATPEF